MVHLKQIDTSVKAAALGDALKGKSGRRFWKSLDQLADTPEFQKWVDDEFPHRRTLLEIDRRDFLKVMGASLMLAGLASSGCRYLPEDRLVPFVSGPEGRIPGKPVHYATVSTMGGYAIGLTVKTNEGRPIKLDGNPNHPSSMGACDARTQARILDMYDPDRLRMVQRNDGPSSWNAFLSAIRERLEAATETGGAGVVLLTETVGSPTLAGRIGTFLQAYPQAQWVQYEPVNRDNVTVGALLAFGAEVDTHYRFDNAKVIVSLDSNVMMEGPGCVRYQRDIMAGRNLGRDDSGMNRIYAVEPAPTTLGVVADHRLPLKSSKIMAFAKALAGKLGTPGAGATSAPEGVEESWLSALAADLTANPGASVVVAGEHQPPDVHAMVHAINEHLGNFGKTVIHTEMVLPQPGSQGPAIQRLAEDMAAGRVSTLIIFEGNPVYTAPADLDFKGAMSKVEFTAHLSSHDDETCAESDWLLPASHFLESWGDGRGHDGTVSLQQPMIEPLYDSKSALELMESLIGTPREGMEVVQSHWKAVWGEEGFDRKWRHALADGIVPDSQALEVTVQVASGLAAALPARPSASGIELLLLPDPTIFDGRFANNGWLQELPKPISNLTWDNAAYMSHTTAVDLGIEIDKKYGFIIPADRDADVVAITVDGRTVEAAVYVNHGMADDVVMLHLGYGRERGGQVMLPLKSDKTTTGGGFNAYPLRTSDDPWIVQGAKFKRTSKTYPLANAQFHNTIDMTPADSDREILQEMTLAQFLGHEEGGEIDNEDPPSMYDVAPLVGTEVDNEGWNSKDNYQWAMTVDLTLCTGCNACVIACQSENNIPTVGKYQVQRGREMHWIRIDRYYAGTGMDSEWPTSNPDIRMQPMMCQHCENAPCEPVCPVAATTHSLEGLNQMVYNRCVGTRYCSNNCPYKVRRFNFLNYANHNDVPVKMLLNNPDVTVRSRGVMEKCTYCVQRISVARIDAKKAGGVIPDGGVRTACQVACPSEAIIFGDKNLPENAVSRSMASKRGYRVLNKAVNTRPRTTYLARVTNPNEEVGA